MSYVTISKAADLLNTSHTTIRRKLKKHYKQLTPLIKQENGVVKLSEQALNFINGTIRRTEKEGINAPEQLITAVNDSSDMTDFLKDQIKHKDGIIKILLNEQSEKDRRHDTLIQQLSGQIKDQNILIEDLRTKNTNPAPDIPAKKPKKLNLIKKSDPVQKLPQENIFQKWLREIDEFCHPWKMRKEYREQKAA